MATVVVLNGTSSSGKTTVARTFQELAPSLFLNFSIDSILYALPASAIDRITSTSRYQAEHLVSAVSSHRVLMVGLDCPADVLIQRERERRERREGMAIAQQARIHSWLLYDLFIATSTASADDAAQKIVQALSTGRPEAFERTRARLSAA